jgi:putative transposase
VCDPVRVRTAYKCRAYPDQAQQQVLSRTFGCVRVVWNRTLAGRRARWQLERKGTSYAQTDRALTVMKKDPGLGFLSAVSSVPLQQALRHQHQAFTAFFAKRARYPRFKSRRARGSPGDACGADVRHSGSSRVRSAVKQEPQPATAGIPVLQGEE